MYLIYPRATLTLPRFFGGGLILLRAVVPQYLFYLVVIIVHVLLRMYPRLRHLMPILVPYLLLMMALMFLCYGDPCHFIHLLFSLLNLMLRRYTMNCDL